MEGAEMENNEMIPTQEEEKASNAVLEDAQNL